jgi:hypothetical protein
MPLTMDNSPESGHDEPVGDRYRVRLRNVFEGPMDLLIHLIRKAEVDIYDIPIAQITSQYLEYLEWMKQMNIDFAGDFVLMASTLTHIKSKMLLRSNWERKKKRIPGWKSPGRCWNTCGSNRPPNNWPNATFWATNLYPQTGCRSPEKMPRKIR